MDSDTIKQAPSRKSGRRAAELYVVQVYPRQPKAGEAPPYQTVGRGLLVGREPNENSRFRVPDGTVSRIHFRIIPDQTGWRLADEGSSNGTYVNGRRVDNVRIGPQDVIRAGNALMVTVDTPPVDLSWLTRHGIVASSGTIGRVVEMAMAASQDLSNVLLLGETGTGKEVYARLIHKVSKRKGRFASVNCAAIPSQLLESTLFGAVKGAFTGAEGDQVGILRDAEGGTLLLDEIGELAPELQAKLLRTLEERTVLPIGATRPIPFDAKVLAATNQLDTLRRGSAGFRQDLLARLEDNVIYLPPLRERREEIVPLARTVLESGEQFAGRSFSTDFLESILIQNWPRNVRQLLKVVATALRHAGKQEALSAEDARQPLRWEQAQEPSQHREVSVLTPPPRRTPTSVRTTQRPGAPDKDALRQAMQRYDNNITAVARHFECDRTQVYRWLKRFKLR